jgi:hypothetical protein
MERIFALCHPSRPSFWLWTVLLSVLVPVVLLAQLRIDPPPQSPPGCFVRLYKVDDSMKAWLNGEVVSEVGLRGDSDWIDLSRKLKKGTNTLEVNAINGPLGYAYGFKLAAYNGATVRDIEALCGDARNFHGCNQNDLTRENQEVFRRSYEFDSKECYPELTIHFDAADASDGARVEVEPNSTEQDGSVRLFPEKQFPLDGANRKRVHVTVEGPVDAPRTAYIVILDVDDPTTQESLLDPTGPNGDDNYEGSFRKKIDLPLVASGSIRHGGFFLELSEFSGDNYRVAASYVEEVRDALEPAESRVAIRGVTAVQSPLATIWRSLHVELNSMRRVENNFRKVRIESVGLNFYPFCTWVRIQPVDFVSLAPVDPFLPLPSSNAYLVVPDEFGGTSLQIRGALRAFSYVCSSGNVDTSLAGRIVALVDDDNVANAETEARGDNGTFFPLSNGDIAARDGTSLPPLTRASINAFFAPAFIEIAPPQDDTRLSYDFKANLPVIPGNSKRADDSLADALLPLADTITNRDLFDNDYWKSFLLEAYQPALDYDGDPNDEKSPLYGKSAANYSVIFAETIGDKYRRTLYPCFTLEAIAAHELGHVLGITGKPTGTHLMSDDPCTSSEREWTEFDSATIYRFRNSPFIRGPLADR